MGKYIANQTIKQMVLVNQTPRMSKVVILGLTFKENCPDIRNSKVYDIIKTLKEFEINPLVVDPWVNEKDAMNEYGIVLSKLEDIHNADCIIVAVSHDEFKSISLNDLIAKYGSKNMVLIDVKGLFKIEDLNNSGIKWWRL